MHTHTIEAIQIDEYGEYYFWKCPCGVIGNERIKSSEELAELCILAYES